MRRMSGLRLLLVVGVLALMAVAPALAQTDETPTPYLGIFFEPAGDEPTEDGVLVTEVAPDSPAAEAQLQPGDVLTAVDGEAVTAADIANVISRYAPGNTVTLTVERGGETLEVEVTLGERPQREVRIVPPQARPDRPYLGVIFEETADGVVILDVVPDGPAEAAGLQADDVIVGANGEAIEDAQSLMALVNDLAPGDTLSLEIQRGDETLTVDVELARVPAQFGLRAPRDFLLWNPDAQIWQVAGLAPDGPLAAAGLELGDNITAFNGEQYNLEELLAFRGEQPGDADITLSVQRGDETLEVEIPAAVLMDTVLFEVGRAAPDFGRGGEGLPLPFDLDSFPGSARLGVSFQVITPELAEENDLPVTEGALILRVMDDSPAAEAGLQPDDIILAVDGDVVDEERTLRDRIYAYEPGDTITLDVLRGDEQLSLEATLAAVQPGVDMIPFFGPEGLRGFGVPGFPTPEAPRLPDQQDL